MYNIFRYNNQFIGLNGSKLVYKNRTPARAGYASISEIEIK